MTIAWSRLTQVRERHKQAALENVARERQASEVRDAQAREAQAQLHERVAAKTLLWQAAARGEASFSIAQLGQTSAWSRALDVQIAQAAQAARQALLQAAQQQQVLAASRHRLRAALGELDRAQQMQRRADSERRRQRELRADDAAEEAASQAWAARRGA